MEKWCEDSRWTFGEVSKHRHEYSWKAPYYFMYDEPPDINGDIYTKRQTKYIDSPYHKFTIIYNRCIYENTANCANRTRRSQHII